MYIGIDLGTSGVKCVLVDETQQVRASTTASLEVSRPQPGWSEQNPGDWITATELALAELSSKFSLSGVKGIGLSGQMHGATVLGKDDEPLRPCILWNDTRSHREAAQLDANPLFRDLTGNIVFPGFTAPKLAWLQSHEPQVFSAMTKVLLPKDYLRLWLTGEHVSEMSDAAGTSWLNTSKREWSAELLSGTGMGLEHMPRLVEGSEASGGVRADLAQKFGLPVGTPVAGGAGDNAASAVGVGVARAGEGFVSLGTSGVLFAAADGYAPSAASALHTFCHALPNRWHQMGVILSASDALSWYGRLVGTKPQDLTAKLGALRAPGRALFLPYLGGERTPHNDARVRGAFIGLEHETDRQAGTRAVLEAVAFAFRDSLEVMKASGTPLDHLVAVGGGARSDYWLKVIATVLGLPVGLPAEGDYGAAFGAARLGMMAASHGGEELARSPEIAHFIEPEAELKGSFDEAYGRYRATYRALKNLA